MTTIKNIDRHYARKIIDQSMRALGLRMDMKTDPEVIRSLLKEMRIDDFKTTFPPMQKFFADAVARPQKLRLMFESIIDGICKKHPAIVEFAGLALSKKWFVPSPDILRAAHVTYILEAMTAAMSNSHTFYIEAEDHLRSKEMSCGLDHGHIFRSFLSVLGITRNLLETMKVMSIDPILIIPRLGKGLAGVRLSGDKLKKICKNERLNFIESQLLTAPKKNHLEHTLQLLRMNIYEAGITEYKKGFFSNAFCAQALNEDVLRNPPEVRFKNVAVLPDHMSGDFYHSLFSHDNIFPLFDFSADWVSLYITWNMAFMLSDSDVQDLDLLMPKLFIPSLINCSRSHFIGVRGISLWLSINSGLFRIKGHFQRTSGPVNRQEMALAWGEINKKYAMELVKKEANETLETFVQSFRKFFSFPIINFLRTFGDFLMH